jgi:hypothetical protein
MTVESVNAALDSVRPYLLADGGDVEVARISDDGVVFLRLQARGLAAFPPHPRCREDSLCMHCVQHARALHARRALPTLAAGKRAWGTVLARACMQVISAGVMRLPIAFV